MPCGCHQLRKGKAIIRDVLIASAMGSLAQTWHSFELNWHVMVVLHHAVAMCFLSN